MTDAQSILIASSNLGKAAAFRRLLRGMPFRLISPDELSIAPRFEETGTTFAENALLKARVYFAASGIACLADDSGLCVDALNGEPGIHSARFGGLDHSPTAQNLLLLERLAGVAPKDRGATFVSVIAFAGPDGEEWTVEGTVRGRIAESIRGSHGFGYDPVFIPSETGKTYAQLTPAEKDRISHRGIAMTAAKSHLSRGLGLLE